MVTTTTSRSVWTPAATRAGNIDDTFNNVGEPDAGGPDPFADDARWPAWKVTLGVVVFCAAFWTGVGFLAMRLLG